MNATTPRHESVPGSRVTPPHQGLYEHNGTLYYEGCPVAYLAQHAPLPTVLALRDFARELDACGVYHPADIGATAEEVSNLERDVDDLKGEKDELEDALAELEREKAELEREVDKLEALVEELERKLETNDLLVG